MAPGRRMASTVGMRARQAEPSLVRPGEPDEYGTWTAEQPRELAQRVDPDVSPSLSCRIGPRADPRTAIDSRHGAPSSSNPAALSAPSSRSDTRVFGRVGRARRGTRTSTIDDRAAVPRSAACRLDDEQQHGSYYGFANEALWPMCHRAHVKPMFRPTTSRPTGTSTRVSPTRASGSRQRFTAGIRAGLPLRAGAALIRERLPHSRSHVLAHPVAALAGVRDLPVGPSSCSRAARQQHHRLPDAARLPQLHRDRRTLSRRHVDRYQDASDLWRPAGARSRRIRPRCAGRAGGRRARRPSNLPRGIRRSSACRADTQLGVGVDRLDLHQGYRREVSGDRAAARVLSGYRGRFVFAQLAEPSRETLPGVSRRSASACSPRATGQRALRQRRLHADRPARGRTTRRRT